MVKIIGVGINTDTHMMSVWDADGEPKDWKVYNRIRTAGEAGTAVKDYLMEHGEVQE